MLVFEILVLGLIIGILGKLFSFLIRLLLEGFSNLFK